VSSACRSFRRRRIGGERRRAPGIRFARTDDAVDVVPYNRARQPLLMLTILGIFTGFFAFVVFCASPQREGKRVVTDAIDMGRKLYWNA
jgi:hypothetical protein